MAEKKKPTESATTKPAKPTKAAKLAEPTKPTKPTKPAKPAEPIKPTKAAKPAKPTKAAARRPKGVLGVGDWVRLPLQAGNEYAGYDPHRFQEPPVQPVQGLIASIRQVATGEQVRLAAGELRQYVMEIIHDSSFQPGMASLANTAGDSSQATIANQAWQKLKAELIRKRDRGELVNHSAGTLAALLAGLLDGWRLVKVRSSQLESLEG